MTNINSTNPVNTLVSSFKDTLPANLDQQREFQVRGYRMLWTQIAEAFFVAQNIRGQLKADIDAALKERGINEGKAGSNPYLPIVKMLYGEWKTVDGSETFVTEHQATDVTVFEPNRSAEKYACVFRYLNKRKDQFPDTQSIIDHIEAFPKHLKGIEDKDRDENKTSSKAKPDTTMALKRGLSVRGGMDIGTREKVVTQILDFPADAKEGQLWFKVGDDGRVYLMGFEKKLEDDAVNKLAVKRGNKLLAESAQQAMAAELASLVPAE